MNFFKWKLKWQLMSVLIVMALGSLITAVVNDVLIKKATIESKNASEIENSKNAISDILPPPLFLTETYQAVLRQNAGLDSKEYLDTLIASYKLNKEKWQKLDPALYDKLNKGVIPTGDTLVKFIEEKVEPNLKNKEALSASISSLDTLYFAHKKEVEKMATTLDSGIVVYKNNIKEDVFNSRVITGVCALLVLLMSTTMVYRVLTHIMKKLGAEPFEVLTAAESIAIGKFDAFSNNKEQSGVMGALAKATSVLADLDHEMVSMEAQHKKGLISYKVIPDKFNGEYANMAKGLNEMVEAHVSHLTDMALALEGYSTGNFEVDVPNLEGELAPVTASMEHLKEVINKLVESLITMAKEHAKGNISYMLNPTEFPGAFKEVALQVNKMVSDYIEENKVVTSAILEFGNGNFNTTVPEFPGEKEFITKSIKKMQGNLKGVIESVNYVKGLHDKGDYKETMFADRFKGDFKTLALSINSMVSGLTSLSDETIEVVKAFGEGDFNKPMPVYEGAKREISSTIEEIRGNFLKLQKDTETLAKYAEEGKILERVDDSVHKGEFRTIIKTVNDILDKVSNPILTAKQAVETITVASKEISNGNMDLSRRTEKQAAFLEETTSNLSRISDKIEDTALASKEANKTAIKSMSELEAGVAALKDLLVTIDNISSSSERIESIISVIEGIAFQTNILALNAAVEAARAGEQGRGFAVVASEVRNLAQKSANAAKEIKTLIHDSVEISQKGVSEAKITETKLSNVVPEVEKMVSYLNEISTAAAEESSGIIEISKAVAELDDSTQQNAALVEEAAAAASSLVDQANELGAVIDTFVLTSDKATERQYNYRLHAA